MADLRIKIVSNPYAETINFYRFSAGWTPFSQMTDPNSKLLNKKLADGFFPFKAQEIVDTILAEFQIGSQVVGLEFEGSDDEFEELAAICSSEQYSSVIKLTRSPRYLMNARDVLPEIKSLLKEIRPLVDDAVVERKAIRDSLEKFLDVSSDLIPLCVLGNYSAGKSTFINALIGHELLPSGDEPVTAKVFQIKRSTQRGTGCIKFCFGATPVVLRYDSRGLQSAPDLIGVEPYDAVTEELESAEAALIPQMNCTLQVINAFRQSDSSDNISDRIDIEVPFSEKDAWGQSNNFVIFDTPGSNASSHLDHLRVLKDAMEGLSNGLPIIVAEYDKLDSMDNEKLYNDISTIEAMDDRFAMIVVNKADMAALPKGEFDENQIQTVMDWTIPRNLYSQGIFFVSSVLGLGAKTNGEFLSDYYAEKFEDQERKYSNPENKFYKRLFRYNILPAQIRSRTIRESEECSDLIFANSGLYCVEREIDLFAEKYSAYNKCHQSEVLLRRIIDATAKVIEETRERHEISLKNREKALDRDKKNLLEQLNAAEAEVEAEALQEYPSHMDGSVDDSEWNVTVGELVKQESDITDAKRSDFSYSEQEDAVKESWQAITNNLSNRFNDALNKPSFEAFGDILAGVVADCGEYGKQVGNRHSLSTEVDRAASDELLSLVRRGFDEDVNEMQNRINNSSQGYWRVAAESGRDVLYQIATNSEALSEEKRAEIGDIIIQYQPLVIEGKAEQLFIKSELEMSFRLFDLVIFKSEKLNLDKLARVYNEEVRRFAAETKHDVQVEHERLYKDWLEELTALIIENITDYSPILHTQAEIIREETAKINELTAKLERLRRCTSNVSQMIDWKE